MESLPHRDVVVIGLGWTGSILANELTDAGLNVIALERGPWRNTSDFLPDRAQDELRYRIRHELFLKPSQTTFTFRNRMDQTALPIRTWGAFMPPNGVGGGGLHWNAETWRFNPTDFVLRTHLTQRYGREFLPDDMTIQDWGLTYADLERQTAAVASWLIAEGVEPGERVMILSENSIAHAVVMFGAFRAGAVAAPVSPAYSLADDLALLHHVAGIAGDPLVQRYPLDIADGEGMNLFG